MQLRIDPEFESRIPPLTDDEFQQLEENILADGVIISPIVVWEGVVIDGHNRFRIVEKHPHISFTTCERQFENRYEALAWICKNQLGRRNLTFQQKKYLIGMTEQEYVTLKARYKAEAEEAERLIAVLEQEQRESKVYTSENRFLTEFRSFMGTDTLTKEMASALVERIYVDAEKNIDIRLRYRDEYIALLKFIEGRAAV